MRIRNLVEPVGTMSNNVMLGNYNVWSRAEPIGLLWSVVERFRTVWMLSYAVKYHAEPIGLLPSVVEPCGTV